VPGSTKTPSRGGKSKPSSNRLGARSARLPELAKFQPEGDVVAADLDAVALPEQCTPLGAKLLSGPTRCQGVGRYGSGLHAIDPKALRIRKPRAREPL
jgi:hypothetical protein